jgi:hypothetical protein
MSAVFSKASLQIILPSNSLLTRFITSISRPESW